MIYLKPKRLFVVVDIYRLKVTISKNTPFLVNFDLIYGYSFILLINLLVKQNN